MELWPLICVSNCAFQIVFKIPFYFPSYNLVMGGLVDHSSSQVLQCKNLHIAIYVHLLLLVVRTNRLAGPQPTSLSWCASSSSKYSCISWLAWEFIMTLSKLKKSLLEGIILLCFTEVLGRVLQSSDVCTNTHIHLPSQPLPPLDIL